MKLLYIELYLYKPFLHHKTKHVTIDNLNHVTVISGENACGKSSLLRAISPYPSISTEFEKGGYKKLIYDHAGSIFEISSDFRKPSGAHSFKKDGVELNESGTTDVQNNLVLDYLQYDDVVEKLVTGKYKICDMSKPERRELLMSTYPSSMGFILDYYKKVSSHLRAVNNNIKMLTQRKISLEQQLISSTILEDYRKEKEDLIQATSKLDLDIYTVDKAIRTVQTALNKLDPNFTNLSPMYFHEKCRVILEKYKLFLNQSREPSYHDCFSQIAKLQSDIDHVFEQIRIYESDAKEISKELSEYKKYLSNDIETQIKECKEKISVQESIIRDTYLEPDIPDISNNEYQTLQSYYPTLRDDMSELLQSLLSYWTEEQYLSCESKMLSLSRELNSIQHEIERLQIELAPIINRLEKFKKHSYPKTCTMSCVLRDDFQSLINTAQERRNEIEVSLKKLEEDKRKIENELSTIEREYTDRRPYRAMLRDIDSYLHRVSFGTYICNGTLDNYGFIRALNECRTDVYNRFTCLLEHAKKSKVVQNAKDTLVVLQAKLTNLESSSDQARQLILESAIKKETKLNSIIRSIKEAREQLTAYNLDKKNIKTYQDITEQLTNLQKEYTAWKKVYLLKAEIKHFSSYLNSVYNSKNKINEKLRELDQIIKEQDNYLIRLNDEVNPELEKLKHTQMELSAVESQLSPTKGLSHTYIIRYINSVFRLANQFIARVWSYPMSLEYIKEDDESFDYNFKLLINESSSIKDINIASAGQKSIINLCVMLAICIFRKYGKEYPIILDEVTVNMSLNHQNSLITFLNELFSDEGLKQVFIVDHCIDVCSSFASIAEMICLSRGFDIGQEWKCIGTIE